MALTERKDKLDFKTLLFIIFILLFGIIFSCYLFFSNNYFIPKDGIETTMVLVDVNKKVSEVKSTGSNRHKTSKKTNYSILLYDIKTEESHYVGTSYFMYKYIKNLDNYKDKEIYVVTKDKNEYEKQIVIGTLKDKKRTLRFLENN